MKPSGIVTLLSDFGTSDPFVGVMKGAVLSRFRGAGLVDLTHGIEPGRIADGAFWIARAFRYFPVGTVHLAVVDPGVGTSRAPIALCARGHYFVGPDNGLFEGLLESAGEVRRLDPEGRLALGSPSRTFHGRDLFAPAAAALASGELELEALGPPHAALVTRRLPPVRPCAAGAAGEVVVVDHFGNLLTNLEASAPEEAGEPPLAVTVSEQTLPVVGAFAEVQSGRCGALIGSFGQLEIFERDGSAAARLGAQRGTPVRVHHG